MNKVVGFFWTFFKKKKIIFVFVAFWGFLCLLWVYYFVFV